MSSGFGDADEIARLVQYLRIRSVQPTPDYAACVNFLVKLADELQLAHRVHYFNDKPLLVMTRQGTEPALPSILLTSHMDVVPVTAEKWSSDPFAAEITTDGYIVARGVQDMKSVGMAYLEALNRLRGVSLRRTIHVLFVPDEEIGSADGMQAFVETDAFKALNAGVGLDEGVPSPAPGIYIFNAERSAWWLRVTAEGTAGHASTMPQGTAMERMLRLLNRVYAYRAEQQLRLKSEPPGMMTSVNVTMIAGGKQVNVIPDIVTASIDMRVPPDEHDTIDKLLEGWRAEGVKLEVVNSPIRPVASPVADSPFFSAITEALGNTPHQTSIFPGATGNTRQSSHLLTDARFVRGKGVPVYGISAFQNTPLRLHDHDECMHVDVYRNGLDLYQGIIRALASV